jgi:L-asparaginase
LYNVANVKVEQLFNIDSVDMTTERLLTLSKYINKTLLDEEVDGVVITHETDTLEETAYFLHLVTKSRKPVESLRQ